MSYEVHDPGCGCTDCEHVRSLRRVDRTGTVIGALLVVGLLAYLAHQLGAI